MNMIKLSWRNMTGKPLNSALSLLLLILGIGLISFILNARIQVQRQFNRNLEGIDMVIGAKGSPLQLILSAVFHLDNPTGNISLAEAQQVLKNRWVKQYIPLSYGDNYRGYRILGTTKAYVDLYEGSMKSGVFWTGEMEVVLGSAVAEELQLIIGSEFESTHGLESIGSSHEEKQTVVGILNKTGTVLDQLILTSLESIWHVHGHDAAANENASEITAALVRFNSPMGIVRMPRQINTKTKLQAALPVFEVNRLMGLIGTGVDILNVLGLGIVIVSGLSVFISLFNAMKTRQYELALMRSYGATQGQLFRMVIYEAMILTGLGLLFGLIFSRIGLLFVNIYLSPLGAFEGIFNILPEEILLIGITLLIGLIASLIPAAFAYRTDIPKSLARG